MGQVSSPRRDTSLFDEVKHTAHPSSSGTLNPKPKPSSSGALNPKPIPSSSGALNPSSLPSAARGEGGAYPPPHPCKLEMRSGIALPFPFPKFSIFLNPSSHREDMSNTAPSPAACQPLTTSTWSPDFIRKIYRSGGEGRKRGGK